MKPLRWSPDKSRLLREVRGVGFEQLVTSRFVGVEGHGKRANQHLMLFEFRDHIWVVPFVEADDHFFLKTAFPSRKRTREYRRGLK